MLPRPPVQYARTSDDIDLAYMVGGEGVAMTVMPFHASHVGLRWSRNNEGGSWPAFFAERNRVVTYDSRGQGLSTRQLARAPTIEDYRLDLETVLAAAGVQHSILVAYGGFAHVALRLAVEEPQSVDALVVICSSEAFSSWPIAGILAMADAKWDLLVDFLGAKLSEDQRATFPAFMKACADPPEFVRTLEAFATSDVRDLLPLVSVPTLVLHSLDQHWLEPDAGARFASRIKGARLAFLDGDVEPNILQAVRIVDDFIAELGLAGPAPHAGQWESLRHRLTDRQLEVFALLATGKTNREIGEGLVLSERTVERHISELYARLGVRNRAEAVGLAPRHG